MTAEEEEMMDWADPEWDKEFYDQVMHEAYQEEMECKEEMVRANMHKAVVQRFEYESNYTLTEWEKSFYIIKLWICYVLGWNWKPKHGDYPDMLCAVLVHHSKTYAGWQEDTIEVGYGLFKNWFYQLDHDSDWNM